MTDERDYATATREHERAQKRLMSPQMTNSKSRVERTVVSWNKNHQVGRNTHQKHHGEQDLGGFALLSNGDIYCAELTETLGYVGLREVSQGFI